MSIPNYLAALVNHKGTGIEHEERPGLGSETAFKAVANSVYGSRCFKRDGVYPSTRYAADALDATMAAVRALHEIRHMPCVIRETSYDIENVYQAGDPALKEHDLALAFSLKAQGIAKVIFNNPHTIVLWGDKTKTIVKCQEGDAYSPETGLFTCIAKKRLGNKGNFNEVFKKHIPNY